MTTEMPVLETSRLVVRPFVEDDLAPIHRVLCRAWEVPQSDWEAELSRHRSWLEWTTRNYRELAALKQPPYGERALTLKDSGELVGAVGLVPSMGPFAKLPGFPKYDGSPRKTPEVGLFWAIDPSYRGHGYATESARSLIEFAFDEMYLARVVATTEFSNERSIGVMRRLGMRILRNPESDPPWFQVVGLLKA